MFQPRIYMRVGRGLERSTMAEIVVVARVPIDCSCLDSRWYEGCEV